jgi:hypothetical protein
MRFVWLPSFFHLINLIWLTPNFKLISSNEASSWIKHAGGASRLMQLRGAKRWTSDFEKLPFQAHFPVMVCRTCFFLERHELKESQITEAFIGNKPCFLESQQWCFVILENNPRSEIH